MKSTSLICGRIEAVDSQVTKFRDQIENPIDLLASPVF
jgi:hypothetical protein